MARVLSNFPNACFASFFLAHMKRWNITAASTGEDAVEYLRSQSFDLVVLDHQLGDGMSGIDVGRFVRYVQRCNAKSVVVEDMFQD